MIKALLLCFCLGTALSLASTNNDEIKRLPGVNWDLGFKHYSGFFKVSDSHFLHYWFVESQNDPKTDPLIFWFNGGPGCSSLDGLLNEMGPYVANYDGKTLRKNKYAWNKFASVVYIEAPAGVGYSYSADGNVTTDDDQENYAAVKAFFARFPEFRPRPTFVMGESYGGVYVPTLAARIIDGLPAFPVNLKGVALGNGYVHERLNVDTSVRYAYGHGLIDQKVWNTLEKECCGNCIDSCDLTQVTGHCATIVEDIFQFLWAGGLNPYDLYRDCDPNPDTNSNRMHAMLRGIGPKASTVFESFDSVKDFFKKKHFLYGDAPCLNDSDVISFMNDRKVREALNIPFNLPKWDICSDKITRTYQKQYTDMTPFVQKIVNAHVRVLLYYGDTDMACNFLMGQEFVYGLGLKVSLEGGSVALQRTLGKTPWKFERQIAGFKTLFDGVTYITVRGAGHMAPQWRAPEMHYAIQQFVLNHPI